MDCKGGDSAGIGVVNGAKMRMQPLIVSTGRSKHGSTDPGSEWAQSRYRWRLQLVLRFIKAGCNIELKGPREPLLIHEFVKIKDFIIILIKGPVFEYSSI